MEFEDRETGGVEEGIFQDGTGEGVREMVKGEGEEAEELSVGMERGGVRVRGLGLREQGRRGKGGIYGSGDVVEVWGTGGGVFPGGEVRVEVCKDEIDGRDVVCVFVARIESVCGTIGRLICVFSSHVFGVRLIVSGRFLGP